MCNKSVFILLIFVVFIIILIISVHTSSYNEKFKVYWNIPTFMCHQYGFNFSTLDKWNIIQNNGDSFKGEKITIFYDPGSFPAFIKNKNGTLIKRNGGLPQVGDIGLHLEALKAAIERDIPDEQFSGLAVLDFELWRPVWRQNWNAQTIYLNESLKLEESNDIDGQHPNLKERAKKKFESYARKFMQLSLQVARSVRSNGLWGYYGFPYCYNPKGGPCPNIVIKENDEISWLFQSSSALFPSIYLSKSYSEEQHSSMIKNRLKESQRITKKINPSLTIFPYIRYRYTDVDEYLSKRDLETSFMVSKSFNQGGAVLWGSSSDLNTRQKCESFKTFLEKTLGPIVKSLI